MIDLSPVIQPLAGLALSAFIAAAAASVKPLLDRLRVANAADLAGTLNAALDAAAGEAYRQAVLHGHDLTLPGGQNAAIALGANYVLGHLPDTLTQLGITPDAVSSMVAARVGRLLAADPTVAPAPAAAVPAAANDPAPAAVAVVPAPAPPAAP